MIKKLLVTFCAALFAVTAAMAGEWDKMTTVTFSQPVELPGVVLPAGTYVFVLADSPTSRHIVRVFNKEQNHLYGTFLALPNIQLKPSSDTVLRFHERPRNAPEALRAWFYPGDSWGHEFVYPKAKAVELAQAEHIPVLSADVKPAEKPEELMQAPVMAVTPENKEIEVAQVVQAPPQRPAPVAVAEATPAPEPGAAELPKTGSSLPLVALMGLFSLALAGAFRLLARRIS